MALFESINRMERIHRMIQNESTGTPCEFAERLHLSRRQLYNLLEEFKDFGAIIKYSRMRETFYYENNFRFEFHILVETLNPAEQKNIYAGKIDFFSSSAILLHSQVVALLL